MTNIQAICLTVAFIGYLTFLSLLMGCGAYDKLTVGSSYEHTTVVEGTPGAAGRDGEVGLPGSDGTDGVNGTDGEQGSTGAEGSTGSQGIPGLSGSAGTDGASGADGYSIVTAVSTIAVNDYFCPAGGTRFQIAQDTNRNGSWDVLDGQQQLANLCNGMDGQAGADGADGTNGADAPPTPFTTVGMVDPCGDAPGVFDEVFIRMQNGQLLASFSDNANGLNTRFSLITAGTYLTTDNSHCIFSVDGSGNLYNEHY